MSEGARAAVPWAAAWLLMAVAGLATRPLLPIDETRYLSVAWEMWVGGDLLVPRLNGEPYSHKPPLLFWLINGVWAAFGVSEWGGRLVAPLFGLGTLALTAALARRLWPERPATAALSPLILAGGLLWAVVATLTLFDTLVAFFTVAALLGVVEAAGRGGWRGWLVAGLALGLGVLSKGPVILVHVLPAALAAPLWAAGRRRWLAWYGGLGGAVVLAAAGALAWALPAAAAGGPAFANEILWGQTAGRLAESFAHEGPWWLYLALVPVALLPWTLWPALWRGLAGWRALWADPACRFCLCWFVPALLLLSLISGKQPHYLVPSLPAAALLAAAVLPLAAPRRRPLALGAAAVALVVVGHLAAAPYFARTFDLTPVAERIARLERDGRPVANLSKYHGQYHFLARLERPLAVTWEHEVADWAKRHPDGKVIAYHDKPIARGRPDFVQRFRGKQIAIWDAAPLVADPTLVFR